MIPLDPTESMAAGCGESLRRVATVIAALSLANVFSFLGFVFATLARDLLDTLLGAGFSTSFNDFEPWLILALPLMVLFSKFALIIVPNTIILLVYIARAEEVNSRRFIIHTAIHQFATTAFLTEAIAWDDISFAAVLWTFHLVFLALLIFIITLLKNHFRVKHEEHLMAVASQNEVNKRELASKIHIPTPPKGTPPPKARDLAPKKDK